MKDFQISHVKYYKKNNKIFLAYNNSLPSFAFDFQCLQNLQRRISQKRKNLLAGFSCTKKIQKQNSLSKSVYYFDEYHFLTEKELDFEDSYCTIVFNKDLEQCSELIQQYLKGNHHEIIFDIIQYKDKQLDQNRIIKSLDVSDLVYLSNYRIFMTFSDNQIKIYIFFPKINYSVQQLTKFPKFVKIPLSEKLFKQGSNKKRDQISFGYVTLDQSHRFYPISQDQSESLQNFPICGIWIQGLNCSTQQVSDNQDIQSIIWGLITYLILNVNIKIKISLLKNNMKGFVFLSFFDNAQYNGYFVKIVDRTLQSVKIEQQNFEVVLKADEQDQLMKIDFTDQCADELNEDQDKNQDTTKNFKSHNSIKTTSSIEIRESQDQKSNMKDSGVQVNSSSLSEETLINFLKKQQIQNDKFYKKTIEKMQGQMELLSQAIISINQNLMLINQRVFSQQNSINQQQTFQIQDQIEFQTIKNSKLSQKTESKIDIQQMMPKISTQSIQMQGNNDQQSSMNEDIYSSNNISEIKENQFRQNKSSKTTNSFHHILKNQSQNENGNHKEQETKFKDKDEESIEQEIPEEQEQQQKTFNQQVCTPTSNQKFFYNKKCEFQENDKNNQSIPIPKINPRFIKNHDHSDTSNMSDEEEKNIFKQIAKKYNNQQQNNLIKFNS